MSAHDRSAWDVLADAAWPARTRAHLHGPTAVGAAVLSSTGDVFAGCNVEHRFRSHCVHAEVNALTSMVAAGGGRARRILIVAERAEFTPCGACMDWIFELGGPDCIIGYPARSDGVRRTAARRRPHAEVPAMNVVRFKATLAGPPEDVTAAREYLTSHQFAAALSIGPVTRTVKGTRTVGTGPAASFSGGVASVVTEVAIATGRDVVAIEATWERG